MDNQNIQNTIQEQFSLDKVGIETNNSYALELDEHSIYRYNKNQQINLQAFSLQNQEDLEKLIELQKQIPNLTFDIKLIQNDSFFGIRNLQNLNSEYIDLKHENNQIQIINLWASWCQPSYEQIEQCKLLLENNEDLKEKVKVINISVDKSMASIKQLINEKQWNDMENYKIKGFDTSHDALKFFQVQSIPKFILIDQNSVIQYMGQHSNIKLEEKIKELLQNDSKIIDKQALIEQKYVQYQQDFQKKTEKQSQITKDEFQQASSFLETEFMEFLNQNHDLYLDNDFKFKIELKNIEILVNKNQQNLYFKPVISGQVEAKDKDSYEKMIKPLQEKFSESSLFEFRVHIIDPKGNIKKNIKNISSLLQNEKIEDFQFQYEKKYILGLGEKKELKLFEKMNVCQKETLKNNQINKEQKEKFLNQLETLFLEQNAFDQEPFLSLLLDGVKTSQVGQQFKQIENPKNVEGESVQIQQKDGKCLGVMIWAYWSKPCIQYLQAIDSQLKELEKQGLECEFKAINLEGFGDQNNGTQFIQVVKSTGSNIDFYFGGNDKDGFKKHEEIHDYCIQAIPFLILVNSKGKIVYTGNLENVNSNIENLVKSDEILVQKEQNYNEDNKEGYLNMKKGFSVLKNKFEQFDSEVFQHIQYKPQFILESSTRAVINSKNEKVCRVYSQPQLYYEILKKDEEIMEPLIKELKELCPQLVVKEQLIETIDVPFEENCSLCERVIPDNSYRYWSYHQRKTYCKYCADYKDETKEGIDQFKVPHNLVCIKENSNLKDVEVFKFGQDKQPKSGQPVSQKICYACNSSNENCSQSGFRYICLTCTPGPMQDDGFNDYCSHCYEASQNQSHPEHVKIKYLQQKEGHSNNHLFLRILYDIGGYYHY